MKNLDDGKQIKQLDVNFCYDSIASLSKQCESAWNDVQQITFPQNYDAASSIIFCGMGGSAYGGRIIKSLYSNSLSVFVDIDSDYHLPKYVNEKTLIIAASYSGNTEETLSCVAEAFARNHEVNLIGISSGGTLAETVRNHYNPVYVFKPSFNPSNQPRLGQGYMQMGQIAILARLGFISVTEQEVKDVVDALENQVSKLSIETPSDENNAKTLAYVCENKIVNLIGGEFLEGALHSIRNPFHETGKHFGNYFMLPEANHHLMEGLSYPLDNKKNMLFLLIDSDLYSDAIKKRLLLTSEVIEKQGISVKKIKLSSPTRMGQVFELIQLGSFITFYLAMLHDLNPALIPWVDYFKNKLKEEKHD